MSTTARLDLDELASSIAGSLVRASDPDYDAARALWNGMIERRPAVIVRCAGAEDVRTALAFARRHDLPVAVRGGGHNVAGRSMNDGGLVLDLSRMREVRVDAEARLARVEAGATIGDLDRATQAHGLATTGGVHSGTGVAGLTLGGGIGYLARAYGLTVDNLVAVDVVLADGSRVRADADTNPDLFWAVRGGGGAIGIVTAFTFALHPVGPDVAVVQAFYRVEDAPSVLRAYRDAMADAVDEVGCYALFVHVPPIEPFPSDLHGTVALALVGCYAGDPAVGVPALERFTTMAEPILASVSATPYVDLQCAFDAGTPDGGRYYYKAEFLPGLPDAAIDVLVERVRTVPGRHTIIGIEPLGGAIARVPRSGTPFPHRDAAFNLGIWAGWQDPAADASTIAWARDLHAVMAPFGTGGVYANYLDADDAGRADAAFGPNVERLRSIELRFDPDGVFRAGRRTS